MGKNTFRKVLAIYFSVVSSIYLGAITFIEIPAANTDNANIILGFLIGTTLSTILGYYFGDSEKIDKEVKP